MLIKLLTIFLLLSTIVTAQEHSNISIDFIPAFDRQQLDPVLIIAVTNHGSAPLTNVTVSIETAGLDLDKVAFLNSNNFTVQRIDPEETQSSTYQFQYPKTRDDITIYTKMKSDQGEYQVRITIPAIIVMNLPGSWSWSSVSVFPLIGLIALAVIYWIKKKKG